MISMQASRRTMTVRFLISHVASSTSEASPISEQNAGDTRSDKESAAIITNYNVYPRRDWQLPYLNWNPSCYVIARANFHYTARARFAERWQHVPHFCRVICVTCMRQRGGFAALHVETIPCAVRFVVALPSFRAGKYETAETFTVSRRRKKPPGPNCFSIGKLEAPPVTISFSPISFSFFH